MPTLPSPLSAGSLKIFQPSGRVGWALVAHALPFPGIAGAAVALDGHLAQ
nr:hypothetical protein [uncultured Kingella sp.]